ncbi:MAG: hypothetical protein QF609_04520 [Gammaproteobacteria bacterium]|jgi:hypothetical protein|nr:hypothetical protein [Gammaproteobacteria bacterium]
MKFAEIKRIETIGVWVTHRLPIAVCVLEDLRFLETTNVTGPAGADAP